MAGWIGAHAHAAGPSAAPGPVPASWVAYGTQVSRQLQDELANAQDPAVARLHDFLEAQAAKDRDAPPLAPVVRLWFGPDGRIGRVAFGSLGDGQADKDLRAVLTSRPIGTSPPGDMRQPLVLRLRLTYPSPA